MNQTLLFFSRSELTFLYGSLHKYLRPAFHIIHVAYDDYEAKILKTKFKIEQVLVFKDIAKKYANTSPTKEAIALVDNLLIEQTEGRFCLNSALQSNRSSKYISYDDSLKAAVMYYLSWDEIFKHHKIDFFVHEPVSLLMNQIAACICRERGGVYTTHILVKGNNRYNFIMLDQDKGEAVELAKIHNSLNKQLLDENLELVKAFLNEFRGSYSVFFSSLGSGEPGIRLKLKLGKAALKRRFSGMLRPPSFDAVLDNIELFIYKDNLDERRLKNFNKYKRVVYDIFDPSLKYYFYPLHLEPEAVVLYWADGLYTNQIKLIENVAAQMPPNVFLYVKDHPHLYGYRDIEDYLKLKQIPNVKLLKPSLSGKEIIKSSQGVITINGTGGFEALLMNKHVITFGNAFYNVCDRVIFIKNIRDLREKLYYLDRITYQDDMHLYRFVMAYLMSQKEGFTDFYGQMHEALEINLSDNAKSVSLGLTSFFINYNS